MPALKDGPRAWSSRRLAASQGFFREASDPLCVCCTDDVARENYEKYGHPDGPQALNLGVALPEWIFSQDKRAAPVILISLVGLCILLPLVGAACFLLSTNKYLGPNGVMQETLEIFCRWAGLPPCRLARDMQCRHLQHCST